MTVRLLLSQPAGGKTTFCINRIREIRKKDPFAPVRVIVPDKMQMAYWKQALARSSADGRTGGFIGTEILSFAKLAMELLERTAGSPMLIPARLDSLCIREAITRASEKCPLEYFAPIKDKPGLLSVFEQTVKTLQHGRITPERLAEIAEGDPKTADTARVYCEYLDLLRENNWTGSAGLLNTAADVLEKQPAEFPHCPLLIADGFDELTKDQLNFLRVLAPQCGEVLITLPARRDSDNPSDQRICAGAEEIRTVLDAGYADMECRKPGSDLLELADRVFNPRPEKEGSDVQKMTVRDNAFLMIEASSRAAEVREALRELKRRIVKDRIHPADCAVYVPDMAGYAPVLRQFAEEMGIPMRFSQKQPLSESPAASALRRLLRLAPDFETVQVLSVLRLPFFAGCPDPKDEAGGSYNADLLVLDRIGRQNNVISGIAEGKAAFAGTIAAAAEREKKNRQDDNADDDGKVYEYPPAARLERIYNSFLNLTALLTPPAGTMSRSDWVKWLEKVLDTVRFYDQIRDRSGRSFEDDFKALLRRITFCEGKLRQDPASYETFLNELESELDAAVQTEQEFAGERVFVGDISQTSGCRQKLTILMGFSEGVFPRAEHEDLILTAALRKKLGLPQETDQQLLFRHAVTRPDTGLIITRPAKTDKGEEWPESIFWQTIRLNLEDKANLLTVSGNTPVTAASPDELAFRIARAGCETVPAGIPQPHADNVRESLADAKEAMERTKEQSEGKYSPVPDPALKKAIADPVRDAAPYSCSAIESWLTCPFRYFLSKKLKLEQQEEPGTGMDAAQIGSLNHKVMELTFPPGTVYSSKEEALKNADKNIDIVFADAPKEFGFRESELWEYEKKIFRQKLLDSIEKMFSDPRTKMPMNGRWESIGAEMKFGYPEKGKENTDPLTVETESGPIRIRGIIDRVDKKDDGLLRVVDYKTGSSGFTTEELEAGSHIQAGVYAAAAVHALKLGTKCEGMYWSINDKSVKHPSVYDAEKDEALPNIQFLNKFAAGMRDAEFPAECAGKSCPDYCPAASWCRKYVRREKYG